MSVELLVNVIIPYLMIFFVLFVAVPFIVVTLITSAFNWLSPKTKLNQNDVAPADHQSLRA